MRLYSHFDTFELYNIRRGVGKLFFCFLQVFFVPPYFGGGAGSFTGDAPGGELHRPQQQFPAKASAAANRGRSAACTATAAQNAASAI